MLIDAAVIHDPILYLSRFIFANESAHYRLRRSVLSRHREVA